MENVGKVRSSEERNKMIKELIGGIEAAKEFQKRMIISLIKNPKQVLGHINDDEEALLNKSLLDKMLSSFHNTIAIAKLINHHHHQQPSHDYLPLSSPTTQTSNHQLPLSKKRKLMPKWTKEVNINAGETVLGLEGPLSDGFCWRKYGQKDILNAKFPRGYYRCTHRHTQGCQAKKQVQRSHQDPSVYQVTYQGQHTCLLVGQQSKAQSKPNKAQPKPEQTRQDQEVYLGFDPNESLNIELTKAESPAHVFRSFSFKTAHLDSEPIDDFLLGCSPTFGSPETSKSNYFSVIPRPGAGLTVQTSESEWNGSISGPSSVSNSPMACDFDFPVDQLGDIDLILSFDYL